MPISLGALVLLLCLLCLCQGKENLKAELIWQKLLQWKPVETSLGPEPPRPLPPPPTSRSVPLIMSILYDESKNIGKNEKLLQGGEFNPLARSVRPRRIEEVGLQRVVLNFPPMDTDELWPGFEAWLVFQLHQSHLLSNKCNQVVSVFENAKPVMRHLVTLPLNFTRVDELLVVNITQSMEQRRRRPSFVVIIRDSTSYTRDRQLKSFANYVDCSLSRASDILELHSLQTGPVLLLLSPELAAKNPLEPQSRYKRSVASEEEMELATDETITSLIKDSGSELPKDKLCRLKEWYVNTEQLDWDFILYPERIPLNLCVGQCPMVLNNDFNVSGHAVARSLIRLIFGPEKKPENVEPCCVPVRYRQFSMLIEKSPGVISLEISADMSAAQCGCR